MYFGHALHADLLIENVDIKSMRLLVVYSDYVKFCSFGILDQELNFCWILMFLAVEMSSLGPEWSFFFEWLGNMVIL